MDKCGKKLLRKTLMVTILVPFFVLFLISFKGKTLKDAFFNSFYSVVDFPNSIFPLLLILFFNFMIMHLLFPIFHFWQKFNRNIPVSMDEKNRVISIFNSLGKKITLMSVVAFVLGTVYSSFEYYNNYQDLLPTFYNMLEGIITGLFTSIFINMSLENIYFPIKSALMIDPPTLEPKFRSYYKQMSYVVILLITFLGFQVFTIASDFYSVFSGNLQDLFIPRVGAKMDMSPEMLLSKSGRSHKEIEDILDVIGLKIFFYLFLSFRILVLLKNQIKNPLETVEGRLEKLTSSNASNTAQIEIVDNNEFSKIYGNINKLIVKQQSELENSRERLHTVIDNAADPIISFNDDGHIFIFNPAAEKLFGWSREEINGSSFSSLFDQEEEFCKTCGTDNKRFVKDITDSKNRLKRYRGRTKGGVSIDFEANFSKSSTPDGTIHTAIIRDISKQILFEQSLQDARKAAERANRLKSEFLANMSHELRTPLNAVLGFTQLLNSDRNLTDNQVEKLNIISRSGEHLLGLINDILDISKIEAGKIELHESVFNLKEFTQDLKEMFDLRCKNKGLALYVEYVDPLPVYLKSDLGKLRQILINILGNAIKFTNDGGISIVVGIQSGKLRFSINDTGKGIPESEIESILQPFTQSSITDNEGGTGLGLAITNSFIQMLGGKLEIESKEGVGSNFSFSIDFEYAAKADNVEEDIGTVIGIEGDRHPTVIIVDDKINNRLILKEMLERVGFVTIEAVNGKDALERVREFKPELVFMDIKMPVMDGYESVKLMKADDLIKHIPVFALTASAFKHDEKSILASGFDGFIAKPFKLSSLFNLISQNSHIQFTYEKTAKEQKEEISIDNLDIKTISRELTGDIIEKLDDYILINDFVAIKGVLETLKGSEALLDFVNIVEFFTNNFDDDSLITLIEKIKKQDKE
ncbi:response regulator [Thiospirochaeta perfilievii]|uniref:histidine kinase n=1 Tax=Thiospirochaeta perfilievii TaxID=252967 RepID=A0A5C1QAK6_9SPIO|nr:ATP-binding protein [Thiospirochaeta perfilievii]QEN03959.1 response regulator [Thiospirochaeta perfilievii]